MKHDASAGDSYGVTVSRSGGLNEGVKASGRWGVECVGPEGDLKWFAPIENLVVNQGLDELLNATLLKSPTTSPSTDWHVGLIAGATSSTVFQASDTAQTTDMNWSESTKYSEANLQTWNGGSVSGQSVSSTASKAAFSVDEDGSTFGGAFLVNFNTKGVTGTTNSSTAGILYSVGRFSVGNKNADNGDTLNVAATFTTS